MLLAKSVRVFDRFSAPGQAPPPQMHWTLLISDLGPGEPHRFADPSLVKLSYLRANHGSVI